MNIKRIATPALLALAIAGLAACGDRNRDGEMDAGVPDTSAADPAAQPPGATVDPAMGDDQATSPAEASALGVLNAINEHEIVAGEQALAKGVTGATADYARLMIDQHTQNRTQTSALGPDEQSQDAQAQRQKGEQERDTLDDLDGEAYRKAYVDAMVKGHTEALEALDQKLIPAAEREKVRQHLSLTRDHVAQHLEQARALQSGTAGQ
ncbi:DUF4142 domain-containing protein [Pseudoxanthomonas sp. SGD-10]|nr:DUF4142 domain-containing protein [Pseudoxanthomonas sp. SGD-10]